MRPLTDFAGELDVVGVDRGDARFARLALIAAEETAKDLPIWRGCPRLPQELVDDDRPATGRTARLEHGLEHAPELAVAARQGRERGQSGVEVAQIRRAQHDLGQEACQRG